MTASVKLVDDVEKKTIYNTQIERFLDLSFWLLQNLSLVLRRIPDKRE